MKDIKKLLAISLMVLMCLIIIHPNAFSAKKQTLVVGVDDTYPPMEFKDSKNTTVGFDVDLAKEVGNKLGMKVEFVSNAWDGIFQALKADKFDCIISSVSMTPDRMKNFTFSKAYLSNGQVIVVPPGSKAIKKPEDLKGRKVGVQIGTTAAEAADKYLKKIKFDLTKYDQIIQTFSDLKTGRIDAIVVDGVVARDYVKKHPKEYKVSSAKLTNEPIGVCFKKSNTALRDKIQKAIDTLKKEGTLKQLSVKWFGEDLTSNIDTNLVE